MRELNTAAGVFATTLHLEDALRQLRRRQVGAQHLSIVGRGDPRDAQVANLAGRRIELDSPLCGAFWVAGPLADSIEASLRERGSLDGHGQLAVGLLRVGVPESDTREYEWALAQGVIEPVIAERMPLTEAALAHELVEQGTIAGKAVLIANGHE